MDIGNPSKVQAQWDPWILSHFTLQVSLVIKSIYHYLRNPSPLHPLVSGFLVTYLQHYLHLLNSLHLRLTPLCCLHVLVILVIGNNFINPILEHVIPLKVIQFLEVNK
jgi:hypothetical protein